MQTRIVLTAALVAAGLGAGRPAAAGPSGYCTFDEKSGIVRIGGASQLGVGAMKIGQVLMWGEPTWNPNWFTFQPCSHDGKFVTLDTVARIDVSTVPGDWQWVHVFDTAYTGNDGFDDDVASGLAGEQVSVMGASSLMIGVDHAPGVAAVTAMPGGVDRDGDGKRDLRFFTKPKRLLLLLADVPTGVTFDGSTYDLPGLDVEGGSGPDHLIGSGQADELNGGEGGDVVLGRGGNDVVWGEWGLDQLDGGDGNDEVVGWVDTDPDVVIGGAGTDHCRLGPNDGPPIGCEKIS